MRHKKGGKSRESEKQVSREAGKAGKHGKAESREGEKQRGSTVEKQRSEEAKK